MQFHGTNHGTMLPRSASRCRAPPQRFTVSCSPAALHGVVLPAALHGDVLPAALHGTVLPAVLHRYGDTPSVREYGNLDMTVGLA